LDATEVMRARSHTPSPPPEVEKADEKVNMYQHRARLVTGKDGKTRKRNREGPGLNSARELFVLGNVAMFSCNNGLIFNAFFV
jgi:hypothetical protein